MNSKRLRKWGIVVGVCSTLLLGGLAWPVVVSGQEANAVKEANPFERAIAESQSKLVKVYGGKLGREAGYATGMVVSANGEILTAAGAMLSTDSLRVVDSLGVEHSAKVVKRNAGWQLALLKIEAETPQHFDLKRSAEVSPGDWALVVSNAFRVGEGNEPLGVTLGVVSGKQRLDARRGFTGVELPGDVIFMDAITSNPGAAGGAVLKEDGTLLGMVGKLLEDKNSGARVNYAIPTEALGKFLQEMPEEMLADDGSKGPDLTGTSAERRELGIRVLAVGGTRGAAYVDRVIPGSEAAVAGVRPDDLVVSVNGKTIRDGATLKKALAGTSGSETVVLEVKRKDQLLRLELKAAAPAENGANEP